MGPKKLLQGTVDHMDAVVDEMGAESRLVLTEVELLRAVPCVSVTPHIAGLRVRVAGSI